MPTAILVDDSCHKTRLKEILERHSYKVLAETDYCTEVLSLYDRYHPDLVLIDISMSEMQGLECLENLHGKYPIAQVLVCSEVSDIYILDRCASLGVTDFIEKPLLHRLSAALEVIRV
ncbi:response regulator [Halobacillus sp. H74]|uniref:response regulator n=1 Tax=Halobacillus sp. H74 TaxID=3457436 RepID=UPI003FCE8011